MESGQQVCFFLQKGLFDAYFRIGRFKLILKESRKVRSMWGWGPVG